MWYRLTITNQSTNVRRYVFAYNMWDLFAIIGWLYTTLDMSFKICFDKATYDDLQKAPLSERIKPDREFFQNILNYWEDEY